jgi:hypothetical protein
MPAIEAPSSARRDTPAGSPSTPATLATLAASATREKPDGGDGTGPSSAALP